MVSPFNTAPKTSRSISSTFNRISCISTHRQHSDTPARPGTHVTAVFPVEIWLLILSYLEDDECIYRKHGHLNSLSLTCKSFNQLAFKELYETLDLQFIGVRDLHPFECTCLTHQSAMEAPKFLRPHVLKKRLNKLLSTLLSRPDIISQIRLLRLPHIKDLPLRLRTLDSSRIFEQTKDIYNRVYPVLFEIFKLCSTRLRSVSGLGSLWSEPMHRFSSRRGLHNAVWKAVGNNSDWAYWDFTGWNDNQLLLSFQRKLLVWENLESITLSNTAWTNGALHLLQNLQSITIHTDCKSDFNNIFPHVPTRNLRSLSYKCFEEKSSFMGDPFKPFVDYLRNCQPQVIFPASRPPALQTLAKIEIDFLWEKPLRKPLGTVSFDQLAMTIFTMVPLLRDLRIVIANRHRERCFWTLGAQDISEESSRRSTQFVAQHLRVLSVSIPACESRIWLADKITARSFPNLTNFTFRSALSRGHNACECTMDYLPKGLSGFQEFLKNKNGNIPTNISVFQAYLKKQDENLIKACRKIGIPQWTMKIRKNTADTCCLFAIDDEAEDTCKGIYSRALGSTGEMNYEFSSRVLGGTICEVADF